MKQPYLIPRRTFLRGATTALALPVLEIMSPAVKASDVGEKKDLRLCVLYKGCGVNPSSWDIVGGSEHRFELSSILSPLEDHRRDITILSGIDSDHRANGTHVSATLAFMTGDVKKSRFKQSYSFDQVIADQVGETTPVKSLVVRGDPYIDKNDSSENYLSYDRDGLPLPVDADPEVVFNRLFRGFNNSAFRRKTQSILDEVKESYQAVLRRASQADKRVLDQYLESVRDVEKEILKFQNKSPLAKGRGDSAKVRPITAAQHMGQRIKAMLDLIAIAFWTDTTRVASMMMAHTESRGLYDFIGINEEFHYLSHFVRNRKVIPHFDRINQWHTEQFAYFLSRLKSLQDGDGTLFDHSVVLYGSGLKHADYHSVADLPLVLSGGGGDQIKLGRFVRYPHAPNGNLILKIMEIMGCPQEKYGNGTEPIRGISETGTFRKDPVDDGNWKIVEQADQQIVVRGLLQVIVTTDDPNLYVIRLSDGNRVEIRAGFGNINGNRMDLHVGSVMTMTGKTKKVSGSPVITNVEKYVVEK
ncbi:MAG: DUF1552 domain-containing protein [Planctomycetota bacterium]|nr:DUF1552 domain-containing protein [Planctomycetota bacterium]